MYADARMASLNRTHPSPNITGTAKADKLAKSRAKRYSRWFCSTFASDFNELYKPYQTLFWASGLRGNEPTSFRSLSRSIRGSRFVVSENARLPGKGLRQRQNTNRAFDLGPRTPLAIETTVSAIALIAAGTAKAICRLAGNPAQNAANMNQFAAANAASRFKFWSFRVLANDSILYVPHMFLADFLVLFNSRGRVIHRPPQLIYLKAFCTRLTVEFQLAARFDDLPIHTN